VAITPASGFVGARKSTLRHSKYFELMVYQPLLSFLVLSVVLSAILQRN
jgi:hypothetical protein